MRIGYINPWSGSAENQAFASLRTAGEQIGLEVINCSDPSSVDDGSLDFAISTSSLVPKMSDLPTFLNLHSPTSSYLATEATLANVLSYDGYLTISPQLGDFVNELRVSAGLAESPVGFFYTTPQVSSFSARPTGMAHGDAVQLAYFGINWDGNRGESLLRRLETELPLRIHGPESAWGGLGYASYAGELPFDGESPQRVYAECGVGLVLMSPGHQQEDIVSNRIFEISSVGAVTICPDIPWMRHWFADSAMYFDGAASSDQILCEIRDLFATCQENPRILTELGSTARRIFEENFSAQQMLLSLVGYYGDYSRRHSAVKAGFSGKVPSVTVLVPCDGLNAHEIANILRSLAQQSGVTVSAALLSAAPFELDYETSASVRNLKKLAIVGGSPIEGFEGLPPTDEYYSCLAPGAKWWTSHLSDQIHVLESHAELDASLSSMVIEEGPVVKNGKPLLRRRLTEALATQHLTFRSLSRGGSVYRGRGMNLAKLLESWKASQISAESPVYEGTVYHRKCPSISYVIN